MLKSLLGAAVIPAVFFSTLVLAQRQTAPAPASIVHGSWSVDCVDNGNRCIATQKVTTDPAGQKTLLGVIVEPGTAKDSKGPLLTFRFTNQANRTAGAGMKIDQREPQRAPISSCDDKVCEVRAWLTPDLRKQMSNGKLLVFAYFVDKKQVSLPVSLNGFATALDLVTSSKSAAR